MIHTVFNDRVRAPISVSHYETGKRHKTIDITRSVVVALNAPDKLLHFCVRENVGYHGGNFFCYKSCAAAWGMTKDLRSRIKADRDSIADGGLCCAVVTCQVMQLIIEDERGRKEEGRPGPMNTRNGNYSEKGFPHGFMPIGTSRIELCSLRDSYIQISVLTVGTSMASC